jgi:hypothetical protein
VGDSDVVQAQRAAVGVVVKDSADARDQVVGVHEAVEDVLLVVGQPGVAITRRA